MKLSEARHPCRYELLLALLQPDIRRASLLAERSVINRVSTTRFTRVWHMADERAEHLSTFQDALRCQRWRIWLAYHA